MAEMQTNQELQLVVFRLLQEEYGLPITQVQEINRLVPITKLPQTPSFVEGIINLRDKIIPVIDLRKRFQLGMSAESDDTRIIIVEISGQTVGAIVDQVAEVVRLPVSAVEPPPPAFMLNGQFVSSIGKLGERLLILLNLDKILTNEETEELKNINAE